MFNTLGFKLMISRSWQYILCQWDTCTNHLAISDSSPIQLSCLFRSALPSSHSYMVLTYTAVMSVCVTIITFLHGTHLYSCYVCLRYHHHILTRYSPIQLSCLSVLPSSHLHIILTYIAVMSTLPSSHSYTVLTYTAVMSVCVTIIAFLHGTHLYSCYVCLRYHHCILTRYSPIQLSCLSVLPSSHSSPSSLSRIPSPHLVICNSTRVFTRSPKLKPWNQPNWST